MDTGAFSAALQERVEHAECALSALLPLPARQPAVLHESMRYSALGGGKRLRAVLLMESAALVGDVRPPAAFATGEELVHVTPEVMRRVGAAPAAAAAVEMVHAFSLVHDDLPCMDDDDFRRGKPTNHKVFGEGIAVLAGDALLARAFEVLARLPWAGVDPTTAVLVSGELATAVGSGGLIGGQVADLQSEGALAAAPLSRTGELERTLEYIHAHKTGALFVASLRMGGLIGGMNERELDRITAFGRSVGLAFQIVDDILDIEGDAGVMGKRVGTDARRGKLTYPALFGVDASRRRVREELELALAAIEPFGERAAFLSALAQMMAFRRS